MLSVTRQGPTAIVVTLDCGHQRHVRHRPPLSEHPWVLDDDGCRERLGGPIECFACGRRELPDGAVCYRGTRIFDENTIPAGLLGQHTTKDGVWGRLVVEQGEPWIDFEPPISASVCGRPDDPIVIPPAVVHRVRLEGPARFRVDFLRVEPPPG